MTARRILAGIALTGAVLAPLHFEQAPEPAAATTDAPCYEDEAYVVAHDPDPSHGLTWECVALDDLRERIAP